MLCQYDLLHGVAVEETPADTPPEVPGFARRIVHAALVLHLASRVSRRGALREARTATRLISHRQAAHDAVLSADAGMSRGTACNMPLASGSLQRVPCRMQRTTGISATGAIGMQRMQRIGSACNIAVQH